MNCAVNRVTRRSLSLAQQNDLVYAAITFVILRTMRLGGTRIVNTLTTRTNPTGTIVTRCIWSGQYVRPTLSWLPNITRQLATWKGLCSSSNCRVCDLSILRSVALQIASVYSNWKSTIWRFLQKWRANDVKTAVLANFNLFQWCKNRRHARFTIAAKVLSKGLTAAVKTIQQSSLHSSATLGQSECSAGLTVRLDLFPPHYEVKPVLGPQLMT